MVIRAPCKDRTLPPVHVHDCPARLRARLSRLICRAFRRASSSGWAYRATYKQVPGPGASTLPRLWGRSAVFAVLLVASPLLGGLAAACALDNVPSLTADGRLDGLTTDPPTTSTELLTYAPFTLPRAYASGHAIVLTELRREVAKSLLPAAMLRPWTWQFGDGATAVGWTVTHAYARPGRWRIAVEAYWPPTKQWIAFDQVTIVVAPAAHTAR